jgi:hypothetical protein
VQDANDGKGEMPYCESHYMDLFVPKVRANDVAHV